MPPDLTQAARPLAALPHRSCEDAATCSPPPPTGTAEHNSSSTGGGLQPAQETPASAHPSNSSREGQVGSGSGARTGVEPRGQTTSVPQVVNMYRLCPKLRDAFAPVGATNSAYSFREVVLLLKKYLFSKVHLFDPDNRLYINCESDPLGQALGVKRFHFNDVRSLISQNIVRVQPASGHSSLCGPTPVPDKLSSSSSSDASSLCIGRSNDSTCGLLVPPGAAACKPISGIVVSQGAQIGLKNVATTSSVPGPSRVCGKERALAGPSCPPADITCPDIPDSCSDTETIYSVQGYETEYCRNTEFESSEEEEVVEVNSDTFEEYELPSDDPGDDKEHYSDSDSTVDDVEIAVLAYTLVQDDVEEGFWADDDSDTDEGLSDEEDNDPECLSDRWDCLTCGLKNKPFVRYCGKCWQLRKNWLPDRPKKRKRKPRPKKRSLRKGMASGSSEQQPSSQDTGFWEDCKTGSYMSESSVSDSVHPEELVKTSSASTTSSLGSSTQDSGFTSSQDLLESQELSENFVVESSAVQTTGPEPSTSKETTEAEKQDLKNAVQPKMSSSSSDSRKRKSSCSEELSASKRSKNMEEKEEVPCGDIASQASKFLDFIYSSESRTWRNSPEGLKFFRLVQVSPDIQESRTKKIAELSSSSVPGASSGFSSLCSICCLRPKNASIIHGRLSHQATCYQCARRLLDAGARCPVCRRKIHMVCKHIIV